VGKGDTPRSVPVVSLIM